MLQIKVTLTKRMTQDSVSKTNNMIKKYTLLSTKSEIVTPKVKHKHCVWRIYIYKMYDWEPSSKFGVSYWLSLLSYASSSLVSSLVLDSQGAMTTPRVGSLISSIFYQPCSASSLLLASEQLSPRLTHSSVLLLFKFSNEARSLLNWAFFQQE